VGDCASALEISPRSLDAADYREALAIAPADWPHREAVEDVLKALGK